ncbi:MAG: SGNH/GDSL hydrolase family protein [Terrimonas sp.]|nr:SGNH/GDSL hydrolase family protein [Terrimonas sp.]
MSNRDKPFDNMLRVHLSISNIKKKAICSLFFFIVFGSSVARNNDSLIWWNPATHPFPVIEGQGWVNGTGNKFAGIPDRAKAKAGSGVQPAFQEAGSTINFKTNSKQIVIRYQVTQSISLPYMPATGVSGVDLYGITKDGGWVWCKGNYSFGDTIVYRFDLNTQDSSSGFHKTGGQFRLYLPLHNQVAWLEVGVTSASAFRPYIVRKEKPIVVYGNSILQGACASRPGMAWTSILDRKLDRPLIKPVFSENRLLEKEILEAITALDARLYVLDCLPDLSGTIYPAEEVKQRLFSFVRTLRKKKPSVPVLIAEYPGYGDTAIHVVNRDRIYVLNKLAEEVFLSLQQEGISDLYYLGKDEIHLTDGAMADVMHTADDKMQQYAVAYEKKIRSILNEPAGEEITTQPCTQYRDANTYDWRERHQQILENNAKGVFPSLVLIGNSITHYWGGAQLERGKDSWEKDILPLNPRNAGFGWDRIENALWRVYHDELDGFNARQIVLLIGSNNLQWNNDPEIIRGLHMLIAAVKERQPQAKILLLGIIPRQHYEPRIMVINKQISKLADRLNIDFADPGKSLMGTQKALDRRLFTDDGVHPNAEGYRRLSAELLRHLIN